VKTDAASLRESLQQIARAKADSADDDIRLHLALPLAERLRRTIDLSEQCIATSSRLNDERDDELVAWSRVQAHLRRRRAEKTEP
jgi:hypothetical protein